MFEEEPGRRAKWIAGIGLVVLAVAGIVALLLVVPGLRQRQPADVEAMLQGNQADREASLALKANYPADYQRLLRAVGDAERERGRAAAGQAAASFMRTFIRSKAQAIIAAPDRELQRIGGEQLALVRALRDENVSLCAQYAVSEIRPGTRMSAGTTAIISRLAVYIIEAARAGERSGRAPRPTLTDSDGRAWLTAMRAIDANVARQIEEDAVVRQPPEGQCRAGVVAYEAVTRLPPATAANVTAFLVRESLMTQAVAPAPAPAAR